MCLTALPVPECDGAPYGPTSYVLSLPLCNFEATWLGEQAPVVPYRMSEPSVEKLQAVPDDPGHAR